MFYQEIICLANSRKLKGRCVAGKNCKTRKWIRPVSSSETGELTIDQIMYESKIVPEILDIIRVPCSCAKPTFYQCENVEVINAKWQYIGKYPIEKIDDLCERPKTLWVNGNGFNDRISVEYLQNNKLKTSLMLIKATAFKIKRQDETVNGMFGPYERKKIRALFTYNAVEYDLGITDPIIEHEYKNKEEGEYLFPFDKIYLCISLGTPYRGYCYKLVAAIIGVNSFHSEVQENTFKEATEEIIF
ncbi:MAG: hypothetical protein ABIH71_05550 [Candidatus Omnitrophota bacterium]